MKRSRKVIIAVTALAMLLFHVPSDVIKASKFDGNEGYWNGVCSGYITNPQLQRDCISYQQYLQNKIDDNRAQASTINKDIKALEADITRLEGYARGYLEEIQSIESNIISIENELIAMDKNMEEIDGKMQEQEIKIQTKKEQVKERMVSLQFKANTNQYVDFIMGATDLVDMVKRSNNVKLFMKADRKLMEELQEEIDILEMQKEELQRIREYQVIQQQNLQLEKQNAEQKKRDYDLLVEKTQARVNELQAQYNAVNSAANTLEANMPSMQFGPEGGGVPDIDSDGFVRPIQTAVTCGMGCYANHIGTDFGGSVGTPIYAPADAIVAYASAGYADNTGYLGSNAGVPQGGGNTIKLIMNVNGVTYSMNFYHLSSNMPALGKATVSQGEVIGYIGQTGNSSGPHLHLEMFQLNVSLQEAVNIWNYGGKGIYAKDWQHGMGWSLSSNSSAIATRLNAAQYF